jgi:hypothetical protein
VDGKFGIGLVLSGKTSFMHVLQPNVQAIALGFGAKRGILELNVGFSRAKV